MGGPYSERSTIWGSILGSPVLWKLPTEPLYELGSPNFVGSYIRDAVVVGFMFSAPDVLETPQ